MSEHMSDRSAIRSSLGGHDGWQSNVRFRGASLRPETQRRARGAASPDVPKYRCDTSTALAVRKTIRYRCQSTQLKEISHECSSKADECDACRRSNSRKRLVRGALEDDRAENSSAFPLREFYRRRVGRSAKG